MKIKRSASLSAAVIAASLVMGTPAAAVAQQNQTNQSGQQATTGTRSITVGHNVVDAVDDARGATMQFIDALLEAEEGLGLGNWEQQEKRLRHCLLYTSPSPRDS